ncbi:hypothetical protein B0G82_6931 [Paraburkholderia sp. BL17N1]|nr:hypothetical protein B0G82_6931 [Paraburkholderia sp. BL17N1]
MRAQMALTQIHGHPSLEQEVFWCASFGKGVAHRAKTRRAASLVGRGKCFCKRMLCSSPAPRTIVIDQSGARLTRGNLTMPFSSLLDV